MGEHPWGSTDNKSEKHQCSWDKRGGKKSLKWNVQKARRKPERILQRRDRSSESTGAKRSIKTPWRS